jgi:two-component system NarL family sensor kinase
MPGGGAVRARRPLTVALVAIVIVEVVGAGVLAWTLGWGWSDTLSSYVVTNSLMGLSFGCCGAVIAWHRAGNPIGWLFMADGVGHATSALAAPLTQRLADSHAPLIFQRLSGTIFAWAWPWSIGLFLPLALMLFPDGHLPSRRWRPVAGGVIITAPLFAVEVGTSPSALNHSVPRGYLTIDRYDSFGILWAASELRTLAALALACAALVIRFTAGDRTQRRQLSWLLLASITALVLIVPWSLVAGTPIVVLFAIPLIPIAVAVAIVRHSLFDIRLVVSRALAWLLLSLSVLAAYVLLVAALDTVISARVGSSAAATVIIALVVAPLLPRLQRLVDHAMYGDRKDPVRVVSQVGHHLQHGAASSMSDVALSIRDTLRVPFIAIRSGEATLGEAGDASGCRVQQIDLVYGQNVAGQLQVGLRPGERTLTRPDRSAVAAVAAPLALAVHATTLSSELSTSRERLVSAREEERRRLRRDLHDGVGPTLTGLALSADAAEPPVG